MSRRVGVVGASARAAAHSLARAGYEPWAVDLFADRDLRLVAPCVRCPLDQYPAALPALAEQFPPGPVLYTGGLENHPDIVAELARRRELWGVGPDVLERVRDPFELVRLLAGKGFAAPPVRPAGGPYPPGRWLLKPIRSAGGLGIRLADPSDGPDDGRYAQAFVAGRAMSGAFVARHPRCEVLGVFDQFVGEGWLHAGPFAYCGTLPAVGPADLRNELTLLGYRLLIAGGLRGPFGIDFILSDGGLCVVEVNPRYTAAMEVLEHATGVAVFGDTKPSHDPPEQVVGKAIYYAPHPITFPAAGPWDADLAPPFDPWRLPGYADLPDPGEPIEPGQPVLTVFAAGSTTDGCRATLKERAAELDRLFGWEGGP